MKVWCLAAILLCTLLTQVLAGDDVWVSKRGLFKVSYESALQPIAINQLHNWVLHIASAAGDPVSGAEIEVTGGMLAHSHGLPTRPRISKELGDGYYRLDGMRFHMAGDWQLTINIVHNGIADEVVVVLTL